MCAVRIKRASDKDSLGVRLATTELLTPKNSRNVCTPPIQLIASDEWFLSVCDS